MLKKHAVVVPLLVLLLSSAGGAQTATSTGKPEQFTMLASNISEIGGTGIVTLDIDILGWTSEGENERLMTAFNERGQGGLIEALQKTEAVARVKQPGTLSFDFHYARQTVNPDGTRKILLLTDRYIGFGEATARTRTLDYPFTLIDMTIDASGRGQGQLFIATKLMRTGNLLIMENFASTPVQLREIKRR
jgi:hypothetical protein